MNPTEEEVVVPHHPNDNHNDNDDDDEYHKLEEWRRKRQRRRRQQEDQKEQLLEPQQQHEQQPQEVEQAEEDQSHYGSSFNNNRHGANENNNNNNNNNETGNNQAGPEDPLMMTEPKRFTGNTDSNKRARATTTATTATTQMQENEDVAATTTTATTTNTRMDLSSEQPTTRLDVPAAVVTAMDRLESQRQFEEARIMKEASQVQTNALQGAKELADGVVYDTPMPSSWTVPRFYLQQPQHEQQWERVRQEWHIQVQGTQVPPPMKKFTDMKFPPPVLRVLQRKKIKQPTPIQMQGLPVALAGRDMVGIAFTGSGKTLSFALPMIMLALEEEMRMPIVAQEGPIGIVLAPSRELARQTFDLVQEFVQEISQTPQYPELRAQLIMGGESVRDQLQIVQQKGVHCVVATPGRLRDVLKRRAMNLHICRYICLDEADRMLDMGFDEEVSDIINFFAYQRQTLLFSATFPQKFQDFCTKTLVQPVIVNVGRAGAANLDVIQEVEYVKEEAKIVYLLHCLQKTAPPVIIFCERKGAADDIHEYLLLKGVEAVCIHGGKDQEERNEAIRLFKEGAKDVLIATDVAAKGLDFPAIQHVINFDMPAEIESYVHRIGRTGRAGKTGVATTFINKSCDETTLLDLKALLREARQRIPPVLMILDDPRDQNNGAGCSFCGGLGHTIVDCPKIDKDARRVAGAHKDVLAASGGDW